MAAACSAVLLIGVLVELRHEAGSLAWWVSVVGTAPVALALRAPLVSTVLVFAPLWVLTLHGTDVLSMAYLLAMVLTVYSNGLLSRLRSAVAALAVALTSAVASSVQTAQPALGDVFFPALIIVGPWAAGRVHRRWRERAEELRRLTDELARTRDDVARLAVAAERGEIARDLHDTLAQSLQVIIVNAEAAEAALQPTDGLAGDAVRRIAQEARRALAGARDTVRGLRDHRLHAQGSSDDRHHDLRDLDLLVGSMRSTGLDIRLVVDSSAHDLAAPLETTVYRMVQEALTNVVKHSAARRVEVEVRREPDALTVEVVDDGGPPVDRAVTTSTGFGIMGMRERVSALGGTLEAGAGADGFRVHAVLPLVRQPS